MQYGTKIYHSLQGDTSEDKEIALALLWISQFCDIPIYNISKKLLKGKPSKLKG